LIHLLIHTLYKMISLVEVETDKKRAPSYLAAAYSNKTPAESKLRVPITRQKSCYLSSASLGETGIG
jgi:hypothetical protein